MSDTYHHNAPARALLLKLPTRYTGWVGEDCFRQRGRQYIKRQQRRAVRRAGKHVSTNSEV